MRTNAVDQVVVGGDDVEVDAGPPGRGPDRRLPLLAGVAEPAAELGIARVDEQLLAGLGVLDDDQAGVGQLELPGVDEADGDDLVALGEPQQRAAPIPAR